MKSPMIIGILTANFITTKSYFEILTLPRLWFFSKTQSPLVFLFMTTWIIEFSSKIWGRIWVLALFPESKLKKFFVQSGSCHQHVLGFFAVIEFLSPVFLFYQPQIREQLGHFLRIIDFVDKWVLWEIENRPMPILFSFSFWIENY